MPHSPALLFGTERDTHMAFMAYVTVPLDNKALKGRMETKDEPGGFRKAKQHRELAKNQHENSETNTEKGKPRRVSGHRPEGMAH